MNKFRQLKLNDVGTPQPGKTGIESIIDNINRNFAILSELDYFKGDQGDSITYERILVKDNQELRQQLIDAILAGKGITASDSESKLQDLTIIGSDVHWYDMLDKEDVYIILLKIGNKPVSMLPFTFFDARFYTDHDKVVPGYDWSELLDCTCVVYAQGDGDLQFTAQNNYPTLYYDTSSKNFCWQLWQTRTGITASGPAGQDGTNEPVVIARRKYVPATEGGVYNIQYIHINASNSTIELNNDNTDLGIKEKYNNATAFILPDISLDPEPQSMWVSKLSIDNGALKCICNESNKIAPRFTRENLESILNDLDSVALKVSPTERIYIKREDNKVNFSMDNPVPFNFQSPVHTKDADIDTINCNNIYIADNFIYGDTANPYIKIVDDKVYFRVPTQSGYKYVTIIARTGGLIGYDFSELPKDI